MILIYRIARQVGWLQLLLLVTAGPAVAQTVGQDGPIQQTSLSTTAAAKASEISAEIVQARMKQAEEAKDLDEAVKSKVLDAYKQALEQLRLAEQHARQAAEWEKLRREGPERIKSLRETLAAAPEEIEGDIPVDASPSHLGQLLSEATQQLTASQNELKKLEAEPNRRTERRVAVPRRINEVKQQLTDLETSLSAKLPNGGPAELTPANRTLSLARRQALEQELQALELEIPTYNATVVLMTLELRAAGDRVARESRTVRVLKKLLEARRGSEADEQLRMAESRVERLMAEKAPPELLRLATENVDYARQRTNRDSPAAKIKPVTDELEAVEQRIEKVVEDRKRLQELLEIPGIEDVIAPLLLEQQRELPNVDRRRQKIRARQAETSRVRYEQITIQEEIAETTDIERLVQQALTRIRPAADNEQQKTLADQTRELLQFRREVLDLLNADYARFLNKLVDLSTREQELIANTEDYAVLIKKHILWIRSARPFDGAELSRAVRAARWLMDGQGWTSVGESLVAGVWERPGFCFLSFLLVGLLLWKEPTFRRRLQELGELTSKSYTEPFSYTLKAVVLTALLSLSGPAVLWIVGSLLSRSLGATDFARTVGGALLAAAIAFVTVKAIRHACRPRGLGMSHFRWDTRRLLSCRRNLRWLMMLGLPAVFVVAVFEQQGNAEHAASLGRMALMFGLLLLSAFIARVLRSPRVAPTPTTGDRGTAVPPPRSHRVKYTLPVAAPILIAALAGFGYYYTAVKLSWHLVQTLWLALAMLLLYAIALRWLYLVRGRLALEQQRQQQQQQLIQPGPDDQKRQEPSQPPTSTDSDGTLGQPDKLKRSRPDETKVAEPATDLAAVNAQTRRLARLVAGTVFVVGVWLIWSDVLPALGLLDQEVWSTSFEVTREVPGPDGVSQPQKFPEVRAITIGNIIVAVAVVILAFVAAGNVPGLLEVSVLKHLPFDAGGRYAIATLARYAINVVGIIVAFSFIGVGWSKVQWLAAALTFGLAFGMQEIFANFVSGVILFLERPIRVGDVVTVDDITGTVTRIQIRATTIRNWDRKEFVVPNKELITGRLLNWTLSDRVNRIVLNVGIAYGSDTERARELLLEIAAAHPCILDDPEPRVTFEEFGDSTLNFVVRAFLASMDDRLQTIHEMNSEIHRRFNEAGIEIAFPQRDIHIRSTVQPPPSVAGQ